MTATATAAATMRRRRRRARWRARARDDLFKGRHQGRSFHARRSIRGAHQPGGVSAVKQLQATGKVTYAYLGVQGQTITSDIPSALGMQQTQGVLVAAVSDGSPAAKAGIKGGSQQTDLQGQLYVVGGDVIPPWTARRLRAWTSSARRS